MSNIRDQELERLCSDPPPRSSSTPLYASFRRFGNVGVTSGVLSDQAGPVLSVEQGQAAAHSAMCTLLQWLSRDIGGLDNVAQVIRLEGYVAAPESFADHSAVLNAASELLLAVFGSNAGAHTRIAVGAPSLPRGGDQEGKAVELALWVELGSS